MTILEQNKNMNEIWKAIKGYEGLYQVSNLGRVLSNGRKCVTRIMKAQRNTKGYYYVNLFKYGKRTPVLIHRLVAETFIPNIENKGTVNHIDGNKLNNSVNNLEWNTCSENIKHAYANGLKQAVRSKKIIQKSIDGSVVKIWNSIREAARGIGVHQTSLQKCCKNPSYTIKGYKWELF